MAITQLFQMLDDSTCLTFVLIHMLKPSLNASVEMLAQRRPWTQRRRCSDSSTCATCARCRRRLTRRLCVCRQELTSSLTFAYGVLSSRQHSLLGKEQLKSRSDECPSGTFPEYVKPCIEERMLGFRPDNYIECPSGMLYKIEQR